MAPHSSILAWKIPRTEEPGGLQSMGSHRVGHDWATSLSLFTFMHWRRKCQPTPVFLPGKSQGWGEPSGLPSVGLHRVEHDWSDLAAAASRMVNDSVHVKLWNSFRLLGEANLLLMEKSWDQAHISILRHRAVSRWGLSNSSLIVQVVGLIQTLSLPSVRFLDSTVILKFVQGNT